MNRRDKLIVAIVFIAIMACSFSYSYWQFDLCYPEVSDSVWYCLQHAWGG
jgi:hypothetical protein